ncbi:MAG: hypothetical protein HYZ42_02440 [Bacteroidetes bacterium]|nr:hypothetical protein [Bacteroidota bacterium]
MNKTISYTFFITVIFMLTGAMKSAELHGIKQSDTIYKNDLYRFSVSVPSNWKIYGQIKDDKVKHVAIVDWELPKIYSELEQAEIGNSISITAYNRADINSLEKLIASEYLRINPKETSLEKDKSSSNARIIYKTTPNGLKYKGKSYYVFKNGIGYVITFMATPGTYDKNIKVFEAFYLRVKYI